MSCKFLKYFFVLSLFINLFFVINVSAANLKNAFGEGKLDQTAVQAGYYLTQSPEPVIGTVIQTILTLLGIIFIILMVYAGGLWMTAKGNEQQAEKAKNLITEAIIGLVIVVAAYAISYFVIKSIGAGNLKNLEDKNNSQEQDP